MQSPIEYKMIPTQYAFFVHEDGTLEIKQLSTLSSKEKFETPEHARDHIKSLNGIL